MKTLAVIPARYASTRLPGKALAEIEGRPLIAHVIDRARESSRIDDVIVATDHERIVRAVEACGARAEMTSPDCASGSDRIAEVVRRIPEAETIVNIQGDEPMMHAEVVDAAIDALLSNPDAAVSTAMVRLDSEEEFLSPNNVKVVCDRFGRALYFSRLPIPYTGRATSDDLEFLIASSGAGAGKNAAETERPFRGYKHFGLYVYRRESLLRMVELPPSPLERVEKLEQMRFLENGMAIQVIETRLDSIGIDTPEELEHVRRLFAEKRQHER